jgi:hypothetical protein
MQAFSFSASDAPELVGPILTAIAEARRFAKERINLNSEPRWTAQGTGSILGSLVCEHLCQAFHRTDEDGGALDALSRPCVGDGRESGGPRRR